MFLSILLPLIALCEEPQLRLKEAFDPLSGTYEKIQISRASNLQPLEPYLITNAAHCFRGSYSDVKNIVHAMAKQYNQSTGGLNSFTIDSQTTNGKLSKLSITLQMKSGALWVWDNIKLCH